MTRLVSSIALTLFLGFTPTLNAEPLALRTNGRTLVEAESFLAASDKYPKTEHCRTCSNQRNLGYFWKDSWFEFDVNVPSETKFSLSLRASSPEGTQIALQRIEQDGQSNPLGELGIPQTREWNRYTLTENIELSLSAGNHRLRFQNLDQGANVDYITFDAATQKSNPPIVVDGATVFQPRKTDGPFKNPLKGFGSGMVAT